MLESVLTKAQKNGIILNTFGGKTKGKKQEKTSMNTFFSVALHRSLQRRGILGVVAMLFVSLVWPVVSLAATARYSGSLVSISAASVTLKPGEQKQIDRKSVV